MVLRGRGTYWWEPRVPSNPCADGHIRLAVKDQCVQHLPGRDGKIEGTLEAGGRAHEYLRKDDASFHCLCNYHACTPTCLPTQQPSYSPTYLPLYLPVCLPTYPPTHSATYLPACLPAYLPNYLPIYLLAYL